MKCKVLLFNFVLQSDLNCKQMKDEILAHINDPKQLEKMYRANKAPFKQAFTSLYPELKGTTLADFWSERLNYESDEISWARAGNYQV